MKSNVLYRRVENEKRQLNNVSYIKKIDIYDTNDNTLLLCASLINDKTIEFILPNDYPFKPPRILNYKSRCILNTPLRKMTRICYCHDSIMCPNNWSVACNMQKILEELRIQYQLKITLFRRLLLSKINTIPKYIKIHIDSYLIPN